MYCEKNTICKLCCKSYQKILDYEQTNNNDKKLWEKISLIYMMKDILFLNYTNNNDYINDEKIYKIIYDEIIPAKNKYVLNIFGGNETYDEYRKNFNIIPFDNHIKSDDNNCETSKYSVKPNALFFSYPKPIINAVGLKGIDKLLNPLIGPTCILFETSKGAAVNLE